MTVVCLVSLSLSLSVSLPLPVKMVSTQLLQYLFLLFIPFIIFILCCCYFCKTRYSKNHKPSTESASASASCDPEFGFGSINNNNQLAVAKEELMCFKGGEDLIISDILDAPGEVIGKSTYGTLYKANIICRNFNQQQESVLLVLRFLRPACSGTISQVIPVVHSLGLLRHPNLVPLMAFYMGPRGEKLLLHPFFPLPNLALFLKDANNESHNWDVICSIALGLAKGLAYLHTGFHKPMIHGNLKSKNVLLGPHFHPYISDYCLYLLLNATAGQEMLDTSAAEGYKAPELMKMKDATESTDIYSLGILFLELVTGREPVNANSDYSQEFYLPNVIRSAILDHRIKDMYHPNIVSDQSGIQRQRTEDRALKLVQLAMCCCSPSPSLRPQANEVMRKVEEISKEETLQDKRT